MKDALTEWDFTMDGYEREMRTGMQRAEAATASRLRTAVGVQYLDRGRVQDALEQLRLARALDPTNEQAPMLEGLIYGDVLRDVDRASEALRAAKAANPAALAPAYALARLLQHSDRDGDAESAVDALIAVLDRLASTSAPGDRPAPFVRVGLVPETPGLEPFFAPVRYAAGFAALREGNLSAALVAFREALEGDPLAAAVTPEEAVLLAQASTAFRDGAIIEAREALVAAIAQSPTRAESHRLLGLVETADGRLAEGIAAYRRAVELGPADERARLGLADALTRDGQFDTAITTLRDTLVSMPDSGRARYAIALVYRDQDRYVEALPELEEAVRLGPLLGFNSLYQTIGSLRRVQLQLDGAIEAYTVRAALTPNDPEAHQDLGDVHLLLGNTAWAVAELRIALALDPSHRAAHSALAQAFLREGRHQEAVDSALRALRLDPGDREARYAYATALVRLGRIEEGNRELQVFQRLQAENAEEVSRGLELGRLRREASVATATGDHSTAAELLGRALVYDPRAPGSHLDLGLALLGAGRFDEAIERVSTAVALGAPVDTYLSLAEAYEAAGRPDDAARARATHASLKRDAIRRSGAWR
jgi:tetratricopeptide (TPR) repeat protein